MHHCAYLYEYGATRVGNIAHLMMLGFLRYAIVEDR